QRGRERALLRHRRRRDGGSAPGPAGHRAEPVHGPADRGSGDTVRGGARPWRRGGPGASRQGPVGSGRLPALLQRQLPARPRRRGEGHEGRRPGLPDRHVLRGGAAYLARRQEIPVDHRRAAAHAHRARHRRGRQPRRLHLDHADARRSHRPRLAGRPRGAVRMTDTAERKMRFLYALRSKGVTDTRVLTAMEKIDRGAFVTGLFADRAYEDMPLPIACGQTISQPSVVGLMTQALEVGPRDKVLEVGTGSGYQAAILSLLARRVYTIDRHRRLVREAEGVFGRLGLTNITAIAGDGSHGLPDQAPFDRIILTAAAEDPPGPLLAQLREGGIMVLPVGQSDTVQSLIKVTRRSHGYDYDELRPV